MTPRITLKEERASHDIARIAWRLAETGRLSAAGRMVGDFHARRYRNRMMVLTETLGSTTRQSDARLLFFPKEGDIEAFRIAAGGVKELGPSMMNPGAIGTVNLREMGRRVDLISIQSHYRTRGSAPLAMNLHRKYGGWMRPGIKTALGISKQKGKPLFIRGTVVQNRPNLRRIINKICKEAGATITHVSQPNARGWRIAFPKSE